MDPNQHNPEPSEGDDEGGVQSTGDEMTSQQQIQQQPQHIIVTTPIAGLAVTATGPGQHALHAGAAGGATELHYGDGGGQGEHRSIGKNPDEYNQRVRKKFYDYLFGRLQLIHPDPTTLAADIVDTWWRETPEEPDLFWTDFMDNFLSMDHLYPFVRDLLKNLPPMIAVRISPDVSIDDQQQQDACIDEQEVQYLNQPENTGLRQSDVIGGLLTAGDSGGGGGSSSATTQSSTAAQQEQPDVSIGNQQQSPEINQQRSAEIDPDGPVEIDQQPSTSGSNINSNIPDMLLSAEDMKLVRSYSHFILSKVVVEGEDVLGAMNKMFAFNPVHKPVVHRRIWDTVQRGVQIHRHSQLLGHHMTLYDLVLSAMTP